MENMKLSIKAALIATALATFAIGGVAFATQAAKDPTKYDCRVITGYTPVNNGNKPPLRVPVYECPHKDKMAAGKCESNWLLGMRCKE
jgi:hypothetical protein